jgi:hypothetical protein
LSDSKYKPIHGLSPKEAARNRREWKRLYRQRQTRQATLYREGHYWKLPKPS